MAKILGIVGGTSPESTADYYRALVETWQRRGPADSYPRVLIYSVEGGAIIRLLAGGDYKAVAAERMEAPLYPDRFAAAGISIVLPTPDEQRFIHEKYVGELVAGVLSDATRDGLIAIIAAMSDRDAIDGVILGGTELALILTESTYAGVPTLNTTQIHVDAGVDWLLSTSDR